MANGLVNTIHFVNPVRFYPFLNRPFSLVNLCLNKALTQALRR